MFSKRTIKPYIAVSRVDTASEALAVSIGEKAGVDLGFMASLMGGSEKIEQIKHDLAGVIFKDPESGDDPLVGWQTADEYLSGKVREKLKIARRAAERDPVYAINVEALEKVQPKDLTAGEIGVRLGTTWIPEDVIEDFTFELLGTPWQYQPCSCTRSCAKSSQSDAIKTAARPHKGPFSLDHTSLGLAR